MGTKKYWEQRAKNIRKYKGEEFYTITEIPFYVYRRNRILEILNGISVEGKRILDFGCGDGYYSRYLKKRGAEVIGVDISSGMVNLAKENAKKDDLEIPFYKMEGEHLEFEDNSFDIVLTVAVLQHIINESILNHLVSEVSRVLVGGGEVIIFERVATPMRKGSTWIKRDADEYIDIFKVANLILDSHFIISSPFYDLMSLPYKLVRGILSIPNNNKIERIYSEVLVRITKYLDKLWKSKRNALGFYVFRKR